MCQAKDFKFLQLQVSIFTPTLLFSSGHIFKDIMAKYAELFDGEPLSIPLPPEVPKEIPRITFQSSDKKLKLEISESRANFYRYLQEGETDIGQAEFLETVYKVFNDYIKSTSAKVGRMAVVAIKYIEGENPAKLLAGHFCKENFIEEPFNRPENFELHSHKRYVADEFDINSWVRCKTGRLKKENKPIITVQQDINTLSENLDNEEFNLALIKKFVEMANNEHKEILKKYFPDNE